jgi:hypothetical protein
MPTAAYPFTRFLYPGGQKDRRAYARLPLRITNPHTRQTLVTWGLVDTGADLTLLPGELAVRLGHKLKGKGVKRSVTAGIEQTKVIAYAHTFEMELLSADLTRVVWSAGRREFDCVASNPPLLVGVEDFLRHFRLLVNYPAKSLRLSW